MTNFAVCDANPNHAVKGRAADIDGKPCQSSGCGGRYVVIVVKGTGAPREYKGSTVTVDMNGQRVVAKPLMLSDRQLMKDSLTGGRQRQREEQLERLRKQALAESQPQKKTKLEIQREAQGKPRKRPTDVDDGGDYIGEAAPWKGVHSRLSVNGSYVPRANLETLCAASTVHKIKMKHVAVSGTVHRGAGQRNAKGNRSAEDASGRTLPKTSVSDARTKGSKLAACSEEWCHLQASSLGGPTVSTNLVAASFACNTYMMAIESYIKNRNELSVTVSAYCTDPACEVADAIRYKIYRRAGTKLIELFRVVIDATAQHFSKDDLETLKRALKQQVPVTTFGV